MELMKNRLLMVVAAVVLAAAVVLCGGPEARAQRITDAGYKPDASSLQYDGVSSHDRVS